MNAKSAQFAARNDLDLVHACKNGNATAFEQLVKLYYGRLLRISQTVTRNREDSEDAVQEALLKAFQNLTKFREDSQFSTWLIRITTPFRTGSRLGLQVRTSSRLRLQFLNTKNSYEVGVRRLLLVNRFFSLRGAPLSERARFALRCAAPEHLIAGTIARRRRLVV